MGGYCCFQKPEIINPLILYWRGLPCYELLAREAWKAPGDNTAAVIGLSCSTELDKKALFPRTSHTLDAGHSEIEQELSRQLPPCRLVFTRPESALQAAVGEDPSLASLR